MPVPPGYCCDRKHLRLTTQPIVTEKEKLEWNLKLKKGYCFKHCKNRYYSFFVFLSEQLGDVHILRNPFWRS